MTSGVRHERDERQQHQQADGVHPRLDLRVRLAARDRLGPEKQQPPAVERRERQQVEGAEVGAQHAEELQAARPGPVRACSRRLLDDADRPVDLQLLLARQ